MHLSQSLVDVGAEFGVDVFGLGQGCRLWLTGMSIV